MAEKKGSFWRGLIGLDDAEEEARAEEARREAERQEAERREAARQDGERAGEGGETARPELPRSLPAAGADAPSPPRPSPAAETGPPTQPEAPSAPAAETPAADAPAAHAEPPAVEPKEGWFARLKRGLGRSSASLTESVTGLFTRRKLDAASLQELEDILIQADLGVETAMAITDRLSEARYQKGIAPEELQAVLAEEIAAVLAPVERAFEVRGEHRPFIVLVVGVNGTGKTTTIGKIAARLAREGKSVVMAAGDTFRAAAVEQLKIWGERTGSRVVSAPTGADAAGLVFDAIDTARRTGADVLLIDTAGRLQNRAELMAELEKVVRVIRRKDETAPHAVLLTLDATTGQNAVSQVDIFRKQVGVTGLVMTKLDGTARGGILVAIAAKHKLPVHFVGVGERVEDLAPFNARDFARAIAGL